MSLPAKQLLVMSVAAVVAPILALPSQASAQEIDPTSSTVHACYQTVEGQLRLVAGPDQCRPSENYTSWSRDGGLGPVTGFVGTYRCFELQVDLSRGPGYAGNNLQAERILIEADGDTATYTVSADDVSMSWFLDGTAFLGTNWVDRTDPDETGSVSYTVSPEGQIIIDGEESGWLSQNGEVATLLDVGRASVDDNFLGVGLSVCVRTALPAPE